MNGLLKDLDRSKKESERKLHDVINGGVGNVIRYAMDKTYTVTQKDIDRAKGTIENINARWTLQDLNDVLDSIALHNRERAERARVRMAKLAVV